MYIGQLFKVSLSAMELMLNPLVPRAEKIKIRQYNFELSFNGLICKGNGLFQCSL